MLFGVTHHLRLGVLVGPLAIVYGALWAHVTWTGRRLEWPGRRR